MSVISNEEITLLPSATQTQTQTSRDLRNISGVSSLIVVLDVTTNVAGSITVSINGKDAASGKYYNILTGAAVTTTGTNRYRVSPHLPAVVNSVAQDVVPPVFQVVVTANNNNPATYSLGVSTVRA